MYNDYDDVAIDDDTLNDVRVENSTVELEKTKLL